MITKEEFLRYEKVRLSGKYNMIVDNELARKTANLSAEKYLIFCIIAVRDAVFILTDNPEWRGIQFE